MPACPMKCVRPMMVKHIFALAMCFEIGGKRGCRNAVHITDENGRWRPASPRANASRLFKRREKGVANKRIAARVERIPLVSGYIADFGKKFGGDVSH